MYVNKTDCGTLRCVVYYVDETVDVFVVTGRSVLSEEVVVYSEEVTEWQTIKMKKCLSTWMMPLDHPRGSVYAVMGLRMPNVMRMTVLVPERR